MTLPSASLAQRLAASGDSLYRVALLVTGEERQAAALLRMLDLTPSPPATCLDEPTLFARLVAAARRQAERATARGWMRRPLIVRTNRFAPFAFHRLALDQRLALGCHLLLGYAGPHLANLLGSDERAANATLIAGVQALGPAAGLVLPDQVSGEACAGVRDALVDSAAAGRQRATVRAHLATCAPCRAFDQAWGHILPSVEATLRAALRETTLPPVLRAQLLAHADQQGRRPRRTVPWPLLRIALAPLVVLGLIAVLVLPGFMREPVRVVERAPRATLDGQALIARAITRQTTPPDQRGVWYGRYETLWFFKAAVYAPLRAEVWLDPRTPARHRLQLVHRDGGAPYELQIGDGTNRLTYALDTAYAPALYGAMPTVARIEQPALVSQQLDPAGQVQARNERMQTGPWALPLAYLRQAQQTPSLRFLGQQQAGERVVQLLSFVGVSPLDAPADAPDRVTVLLTLDSEDGLLRSATEFRGAAGSEQTSRVTWRLVEERWLTEDASLQAAFAVAQAWTGIGDFARVPITVGADPALPLIARTALGDPERLLARTLNPTWLPARPPIGVTKALLVWNRLGYHGNGMPEALIYWGEGRRLIFAFNRGQRLEGERLSIGAYRVTLRPSPGQHYTVALNRPSATPSPERHTTLDPSAQVVLDAYGFTRAELLALLATLQPFDQASLTVQTALFVEPDQAEHAGRVRATP